MAGIATPHAGDQTFVGASKNTAIETPETLKALTTFKFRLSLNGATIGYLGKGGSQSMWAMVVDNQNDAVPLQWYAYNGVNYLLIDGFGYMTWSGGLSGSPVAFNTWAYANGWKEVGGLLIAVDSGAPLSLYSSGTRWLYANSSYSVVQVSMV